FVCRLIGIAVKPESVGTTVYFTPAGTFRNSKLYNWPFVSVRGGAKVVVVAIVLPAGSISRTVTPAIGALSLVRTTRPRIVPGGTLVSAIRSSGLVVVSI